VAISGTYRHEAKTEANPVFRSEFRYGNFRRVVPLPIEVQNDRVTAEFKDGILTLTLPKVVADRNQVVKINLNHAPAPTAASDETQAEPAPTQPATQPDSQPEDVWAD
jgi:HSP20 family protein